MYWLKLLKATDYLSKEQAESLLNDAEELCKIIGKIQITIKTRNS
jgi:four helix bundle protein